MLLSLCQSVIDGLVAMLQGIANILPGSPFNGLSAMTLDSKWFGYLCYIVPVPQIIALLESWGVAVGLFYVYMIVLRWIKAIE
jgi:uncharacterized protein (DUF486 family)